MNQQDYIKDISEIRSMMERSTKFLSLSGWAGIMAGIYALAGVYVAYRVYGFNPEAIADPSFSTAGYTNGVYNIVWLATAVLVLSIGTAFMLSRRKAARRNERFWSPTSRRMMVNMSMPLVAGGLLILILVSNGLTGLMAPLTLIFYGLSLYNAGKFTFGEIRVLGVLNVILGLLGAWFISYGMLLWAFGFGVLHIIYGILLHYKYDR